MGLKHDDDDRLNFIGIVLFMESMIGIIHVEKNVKWINLEINMIRIVFTNLFNKRIYWDLTIYIYYVRFSDY